MSLLRLGIGPLLPVARVLQILALHGADLRLRVRRLVSRVRHHHVHGLVVAEQHVRDFSPFRGRQSRRALVVQQILVAAVDVGSRDDEGHAVARLERDRETSRAEGAIENSASSEGSVYFFQCIGYH